MEEKGDACQGPRGGNRPPSERAVEAASFGRARFQWEQKGEVDTHRGGSRHLLLLDRVRKGHREHMEIAVWKMDVLGVPGSLKGLE